MTPLKDDKETKEEPTVQVLSDDDSAEVEEAKDGGEEVTGDVDEDDEVQVLQSVGGPSVPSAKDEDEEDEEEEEEDDDDDEEDDEEEEDLGTEYLVRPVGEVEDEDDASDFEPEVDGVEEDIDEEIEEEDADEDIKDINLSAGKSGKRKRVVKDHNEPADVTGADDIRPSKH